MPPSSPFHLTFLLLDGFSNMVLASAIEPLRAARDLSGQRLFSWQMASLDGAAATSSSRLSIGVDLDLARVGATDALVVVAGYGVRDRICRATLQAVRHKARGLPLIGGIDTGAWLLAEAGLLAGRRATIHWMESAALAEAFPEIAVVEAPYVVDGPVLTCGGAQGVLAWSLDLIRQRAGEALCFDVANMFAPALTEDRLTPPPPGPAGAPETARAPRRPNDHGLPPPLMRAVLAMRESAEAPQPLAQIAAHSAVSARTLDRLFHARLGMSAGRYYRLIRLSHARALATETSLTLDDIAARTGFSAAATLARAYRSHFGESLGQTRRTAARR